MDHLLKPVQALVWAHAKELLAAPSSIWYSAKALPASLLHSGDPAKAFAGSKAISLVNQSNTCFARSTGKGVL